MTQRRPNLLIVMVDQLSGTFFPDGPADFLHTPSLKVLAARSARFVNAYTTSPLCLPARASLAAGQLPSRTRVYDNAAEFAAAIPTFAHYLRRAGYFTCLSGKMHFVGPDQLHGFEERLTTDIYPADFGWTPDYRKPGERIDWWYHNLGSVTGAGVAETTNLLEYDDEVAFLANQKLHELARESDDSGRRRWCLMVSFTHPHDPYVARRRFWDLNEGSENLQPNVGAIPFEKQDPHSKRLMHACDYARFNVTDDDVRRSRRAYFANVSYLDEKVGELVDSLRRTRMLDDTVIVFCADHGDMLGERGLWFKMNFFEGSARVPLMVAGPGIRAGKHLAPVSILDLTPTLCDLAGIAKDKIADWTDGESLRPVMEGGARSSPVLMEYAAEGSYAPLVGIRDGDWKYVRCVLDPDQLFNLAKDPNEQTNLAGDPAHAVTLSRFRSAADARWDLARFDADVRESQAQRGVVYEALRKGVYTPWDYEPRQNAAERFMRNHMNLDTLEGLKRFPRGE
ncbi:MAG TPA: choline-sulfatase [Steroidobacteraceae bacterium]|nr:choline-sulfatase [Steroidobacteraceae bacterium]